MSSTPTTRNGFDKQAYGDNPDLWGIQNLNTDLDLIDESLDGVTSISTTGGTTTLSATNYATNQARKRVLVVTGVLVSGATIVIPNVEKWYIVVNNTTGSFPLTINTSGGSGCTVTQGCTWIVRCDGSGSGTSTVVTQPPNLLPAATGSLNMNTQKITGLLAGSAASDAVRYDQLPGPAYYANGGTKTAAFNIAANTDYTVDLVAAGASFAGTLYAAPADADRLRITILADGSHTFTLNGTTNTVKINNQSVDGTITTSGVLHAKYETATVTWVTGFAPFNS